MPQKKSGLEFQGLKGAYPGRDSKSVSFLERSSCDEEEGVDLPNLRMLHIGEGATPRR